MTHDAALKLFGFQQAAWDARDAAALARDYTEDGTIVSPIFKTVQGMDAILDSFHGLFEMFPDWQYIGQELLVDGDSLAQPFVVHATHTREFMGLEGTGRKFDIQGVRLFKMHEGLIAYERRYYDFTGFLIQLGVLRGKPARPESRLD
jgi:predicted ester cyclase